jgi:hypothetical protein
MLGGKDMLTSFGRRRLAKDIFVNNEMTDVFFHTVRNPDTSRMEVSIKPAVVEVYVAPILCLFFTLANVMT